MIPDQAAFPSITDFRSWFSEKAGGLRLLPQNQRAAFGETLASIVAVTVFILVLDTLFRNQLPAGYADLYASPLWPRTPLVCLMALVEEIKFRLVLMTVLIMAEVVLRGRASRSWIIAAIILSQLVNVWPWVLAYPLYAGLRYWLVGCVWGWVYWRHGWATAAAGHGTIHLLLDPLLMWTL